MVPSFYLASSVCRCLQCLISALTQGGEGGHLFRLSCSVVLWGGRGTADKYQWRVGSARSAWATLGLPQLMVCVLSWSTLLRLQVALQRKCLKRALGCMHFPGLSHSGSGSCVLHKGTDSAGPAFYALPRSEQLRRPGACRACSQVDGASFHLPGPTRLVSWVRSGSAMSCVWCVSSVGLISGCDPPG